MSDMVSQPKRLKVNCDDDNERKSQNDNVQTRSIDILNDFCLLQIFNRLDVNDLCNMADVNHQFRRVSNMSFAGRYAKFRYPQHLKQLSPYTSSSYMAQMRRVLCKFGDMIKSMNLKDFHPAGFFIGIRVCPIELDVISKYCAGTMNDLHIYLFRDLICNDLARPLFSSLKSLTIHCGGFEGKAGGLWSECQELRVLRITKVPYTNSVSEVAQQYRKLEELYIGNTAMLNAETTSALLRMNRQIKKLNMPDDNAYKTIYAVAFQLVSLEELILRHISERNCFYDNVTELSNLKSLKVLELHGVAPDFVEAIESLENVPLDSFKWVSNCPSDLQFINRITKFKTLKVLALTGISLPFDDCLAELGEQLPLLHELELGFKHLEKPLLSIGCLIKFVERSTSLDALVIHTIHTELFNQQFYDALLEAIERRQPFRPKTFKVTVHCLVAETLQLHSNALVVKFIECGYYVYDHRGLVVSVLSYENDDDDYAS